MAMAMANPLAVADVPRQMAKTPAAEATTRGPFRGHLPTVWQRSRPRRRAVRCRMLPVTFFVVWRRLRTLPRRHLWVMRERWRTLPSTTPALDGAGMLADAGHGGRSH